MYIALSVKIELILVQDCTYFHVDALNITHTMKAKKKKVLESCSSLLLTYIDLIFCITTKHP